MKMINLQEEKSTVSRELIKKFGEGVYNCEEVDSILISVKFKDGNSVSFRRAEMEDRFKKAIEEEDEE